jgi:hypothetical protein
MSVRPLVPSLRLRAISTRSASRIASRLRTKRPHGESRPRSIWKIFSAMNGAEGLFACATKRSTCWRKDPSAAC